MRFKICLVMPQSTPPNAMRIWPPKRFEKAPKLPQMSIRWPNGARGEHPQRSPRAKALNARNKRNIASGYKKQAGKQK